MLQSILLFSLIVLFDAERAETVDKYCCPEICEKIRSELVCARSNKAKLCTNGPEPEPEPYTPRLLTDRKLNFKFPIKFRKTAKLTKQPQTTMTCLLVPKDIFADSMRAVKVDSYLHRTKSIVLDFYEWYTNGFERIMNVKNRHIMVLKVLAGHLNRSLSSCGSSQFKSAKHDKHEIDFATVTTLEKRHKYKTWELFHPREQSEVGFAAVRKQDYFSVLVALVKPIGWKIFFATGILIPILTLFVFLYQTMSDNMTLVSRSKPETAKISGFLIRAHIDQCVENKNTTLIVGKKMDLRILYMSWLFYCLIVTTTYRTNLIQELMKPAATISPETFEELLADPRPFVGFDGGKGGQRVEVGNILASEAIAYSNRVISKDGNDNVYKRLGERYKKRGIQGAEDVLETKLNMFDEVDILHEMFEILERKYGIQHYKIAKVSLTNDISWAVKRSQGSARILETLEILATSGILDFYR